ncbi:heme/copper-type cytochrome/quinol oxidase subunit 4 [Paraburkholderia sp. GAS448]|uniref:hypothetical protein n=1 Tax=Paraburkholderia sp. GAS448 TaxID=3035136 RepID=UPI003D1C3B61
MIIHEGYEISTTMIVFVCAAVAVIAGLLVVMHMRHRYHPNLIGVLIGALLCFLLLEALPAIT